MSSVGNPGNVSSGKYTNAPDKGSFPLDRLNKCKSQMQSYVNCLKANKHSTENCRIASATYLNCRMTQYLLFI